jgi:hypothetical protein
VVEHGDPFRHRHERVAALPRDLLHEVEDRLLGRPVVPTRQRIRLYRR